MVEADNQTNLVNPPGEQTNMTAPDPKKKAPANVKVKVLRTVQLSNGTIIEPVYNPIGKIMQPKEIMVTEEEAKRLCDKTFSGPYAFSGERMQGDEDCKRQVIVRAVRV